MGHNKVVLFFIKMFIDSQLNHTSATSIQLQHDKFSSTYTK